MDKLKLLAPNFLRIGIALIIMWFGFQQLLHPTLWTGFLPDFVKSFPISQITFIYLNGWLEVFLSLLMILGIFTRVASLILGLHLIGIVFTLGYGATAVRDLGLAISLLIVFLNGEDNWSILNK